MMIANMQKITEEWIERSRQKPYTHQITGVTAILNKPFFMLADEMGAGKTKQVIDAAQVLFVTGQIDRVVVLAPGALLDERALEARGRERLAGFQVPRHWVVVDELPLTASGKVRKVELEDLVREQRGRPTR